MSNYTLLLVQSWNFILFEMSVEFVPNSNLRVKISAEDRLVFTSKLNLIKCIWNIFQLKNFDKRYETEMSKKLTFIK